MKKLVKKRTIPVLLSAALLAAPAVQAETPYYGKSYSQPEQVRHLFPEIEVIDNTPAFSRDGDAFTSQEEMMAYIKQLKAKSPYLTVKTIGTSQEGREIPALYFTKDKHIRSGYLSKKPIVWVQSQIHGNEPASGESILALANRLAGELGKEILDDINVIVIPRVNPDGSYDFKRQLADGLDGNRDHIKLESPEVQAIHEEFNKYSPEVVIDAHEYSVYSSAFNQVGEQGALKYHDILIQSGRNLNIPEKSVKHLTVYLSSLPWKSLRIMVFPQKFTIQQAWMTKVKLKLSRVPLSQELAGIHSDFSQHSPSS